ncbi:Alcohol dehydrogenase [acceptor] [Serratia liquefaciens]|jgi:choline dehydrogenase|uniref:GMC family oxidoreductase n=1 Tax=Serratia TaxID=613 RepID=UPI000DFDD3EE|nr:GMC family oxidoreductase N-terminal domain-containing protein [Serratia liquefaciens]MBV0841939.1 GMC family oxidoreductase N-terminal domain-containing protein [Serratia liquefaciens]MCH4195306.1 GMC family oxidoreductase N-terminal domain-containing protein [Serratia liquefaciens]MCH4234862.1 GMC family oxidoreductase N-terminal domain-containing protein [Serratia liquefaciens]MCH4260520.1 GMC family oxidoreductase N-terminal domain-containing protein [Serratia liquefaciens]MCI1213350.1 
MKQDKLQTDAGRRRFIAASLAMSAAAALPFSGYARQPAPRSTGTGSDDKKYDYIIIGAGSAGSVVTRRLVDAGLKVLLLEAGPRDDMPAIHNPPEAMALWHSAVDWGFSTQPQIYAGKQDIYWPRGKTLGGSSAINGMMYVRGLPSDYDNWAAMGATGWSWKDVLPYFRKAENCNIDGLSNLHATGGLLQVSRPAMTPLAHAFVEAGQQAGLRLVQDYNNGQDSTGVSFPQYTMTPDGKRASAWVCYGDAIRGADNLSVITEARVLKLLNQGDHITGVHFVHRGTDYRIEARHEVLLCAGSLMSPSILLHSGIGPAEQLEKMGIKTLVNLPGVGENLHDHLVCPMVWSSPQPVAVGLASGIEAQIFHKSAPELSAPDTQSLLFTMPFMPGVTQGYTVTPGLVAPKSRGRLWLNSRDPLQAPLMDPRVYSENEDLEVMTDKALLLREVMKQTALAPWRGKEMGMEGVNNRDKMRDYIRRMTASYHHQVGTARMGTDNMAVVDPQLRVHGLSGLRVIDASVMPVIPTGNTNAPSIMIGEKAADMILSSKA